MSPVREVARIIGIAVGKYDCFPSPGLEDLPAVYRSDFFEVIRRASFTAS